MKRAGLLIVLCVVLGACGQSSNLLAGSSPLDGEWRLISGSVSKGEIWIPPDSEVTLEIDGQSMKGYTACNSHHGTIDVDGDSLDADPGRITMMGCTQRAMESEYRYLAALAKVTSWENGSADLTMSGPGVELGYEEVTELPPSPLTETRWELHGVVEGTSAESSVSSPFFAHLILKDDGTFTATTGCRKVSGRWQETDDGIETSHVNLGRMRCPDFRREQDARIVEALQEGFTVSIEENEMTVGAASGSQLIYRSGD